METKNGSSRTLSIFAAVFVLAAVIISLFGIITVKGNSGMIAIPTDVLIGGGEVVAKEPLGITSISYAVNVPILISAQLCLLSFLACLLSGGSKKTSAIALSFLFLTLIAVCLTGTFVHLANPAIPLSSVGFTRAFFLTVCGMVMALLLEVLSLIMAKPIQKGA